MGFTFLTLLLISFSCDFLRLIFRKQETQKELHPPNKKPGTSIEYHTSAIISAAIFAYTGTDPDSLSIKQISDDISGPQQENEPNISQWALTGREELMETRRTRHR
jgi:hypothetical protein